MADAPPTSIEAPRASASPRKQKRLANPMRTGGRPYLYRQPEISRRRKVATRIERTAALSRRRPR